MDPIRSKNFAFRCARQLALSGTDVAQTALFHGSTFIYWPSNIWIGSSLGGVRVSDVIFDTQAYLFFLFSPLFCLKSIRESLMVFLHIHECCRCTAGSYCFISFHLLLSLAQSMAAAATCILPAASYHDGDSTVGAHAGWCWLNGTLHHLEQTNSHTHTYRATAPKMLSASRPSNNSSPAIARVRPHRCSQIWVNDTPKLAEISWVTLVAFGDFMHIFKCTHRPFMSKATV